MKKLFAACTLALLSAVASAQILPGILAGGGAVVPVTVDAVTAAPADTSTNQITISHTIGSGSNRLLVVMPTWISSVAARVVTAMTYNGVAMTQHSGAAQLVLDSINYDGVDIWYMKEADLPAAGAYNVVITTTNFVRQTAGIISFFATR